MTRVRRGTDAVRLYREQLMGRQAFPTCRCQRTAPPHSSTGPRWQVRLQAWTCSMMPASSLVLFSTETTPANGNARGTDVVATPNEKTAPISAKFDSFFIKHPFRFSGPWGPW